MRKNAISKGFVFLIAALFCLSEAKAQSPDVQTFGTGNKVVLHSRMELSQSQKNAYLQFRRKAGYFGAIAFHKAGGSHFWIGDMHDLAVARQFAMGGCEQIATQHGEDPKLCVLYASKMPKDMDPHTNKASGLGEAGLKAFNGPYTKNQKPGRYGAFAISGMGETGFSWDYPGRAEAVDAAMSRCEAQANLTISGWAKDVRNRITRLRLNKCKLVHVTEP